LLNLHRLVMRHRDRRQREFGFDPGEIARGAVAQIGFAQAGEAVGQRIARRPHHLDSAMPPARPEDY
jgi:hypothetical protein